MEDEIKKARKEGVVTGARYVLVAALIVAMGFGFIDYQKTRASALMGETAYRWILAGVTAGRIPNEWPAPVAKPAPVASATPTPQALATPEKSK